ncbi:histidine phosphatase family protein [Azospirillum sp. ST 5-10]|uniref:histidine phosphatase family protein n=1 Tax=unclassified Azospirillum TaxID=2630922 RepID=UPI003F49E619
MTGSVFARRGVTAALMGAVALLAVGTAAAEPPVIGVPAGSVVLMRHAEAPGIGDPPGFRLGDCATQRNLDDGGRAQARRMGDRLRDLGIREARVLSSQWCRCLETARLLRLGPVTEEPALNSFFGRSGEREATVAAVRRLLAALPGDGTPVVLVTHQVTITALTGLYPAFGEAILLRADGTGEPPVLGRVTAGRGEGL